MDTMDKFKISQTITDFSWYKRKKGGVWMLNEQLAWKAPGTVDGPSQVEKITNLKIVAGDMIRDLVDEGDKWEYRLSVAWAVRAEDADNAFEGKHRITLIYSESGGTGKGSILQKPIEVFK